MFPRVLPLAAAVMLYASTAAANAAPAVLESLNLLDQAGTLPEDFRDHFFDAPLVVRVEVDGRYLGDARVVLARNNSVSLLGFAEVHDSEAPAAERERWQVALAQPRALGMCDATCPDELLALHYSLESSLLSIATTRDAMAGPLRHHALPEGGSRGLILRHQFNAHGGEREEVAGRYAAEAQASLGTWTLLGHYQLDRSAEEQGVARHALHNLYAQRELNDHFLRVGWFTPGFQGVTRQPRGAGQVGFTTAGVMAGSSDSLRVDTRAPSMYPVFVTANREGSVEVYRDGSLLLTQALQPGLQPLETARLPGGIYEVELRVIEDGRETSRESALIHKPAQWSDPTRRWRYSVFAGVQGSVLDSVHDPHAGDFAAGGVVNYLAHPRAVLGMAAQQVGADRAFAASLDWQVNDRANLFTNAYTSDQDGSGVDVQGLLRYRNGSVIVTHNRSWQERRAARHDRFPDHGREVETRSGWLHTSAMGVNHRLGDTMHLAARVSHHRGISNGTGVDLSLSRRQTLFGADATWRASVFDRPASASTGLRRNRGIDFTLNIALGGDARSYSGGLGTRTNNSGGRDLYISAGVQQGFEDGLVRSLAGQATVDGEGFALSGNAQLEHPALRGDIHVQRSSLDGRLSGGVNLDSVMAIGGGRLAVASEGHVATSGTGMIVDVRSDLSGAALRAHDSQGGSYVLRPGRNLLPVTPYRAGTLQIDFDGRSAPAAAIQPALLPYHLNKGGVTYSKVEIVSTVTVMGHLRDAQGRPLAGAHVLNHAGRSVTEADGFFALEMNSRMPTLDVRHPRVSACRFELDGHATRPQGETWMAGILACPPSGTADRTAPVLATGEPG